LTLGDLPVNGKIYFAGIGGISMSALAMILYNKGYDVCGYDRTASALTAEMEKKGIRIFYETKESNLDGVSCAIYSAALKSDNPEIIQINKKGIPLYKRAELLGAIAREYANSVGVAGTHGKSTTSGMLSYIFMHGKTYDPTVIVGAVLPNINSTFRLGSDENFIFEADEYTDSFLSFFPHIAVVLNIKMDHTDYFPNYERYIQSFNKFINNTGSEGYTVINKECDGCTRGADDYSGTLITYSAGGDETADFYAKNVVLNKGFASFDVFKKGEFHMSVELSVPGTHNVANALAAIACCDLCGVDKETVSSGLKDFKGVRRRFEYKGQFRGGCLR
jgi:UDP-N-acetylmuramate--alanine ligase